MKIVASTKSGHRSADSSFLIDNSLSLLDDCVSADCMTQAKEIVRSLYVDESDFRFKLNQYSSVKKLHGLEAVDQAINGLSASRSNLKYNTDDFTKGSLISIVSDFTLSSVSIVNKIISDSVFVELLSIEHRFKSNVFVDSVYVDYNSFSVNESKIVIVFRNSGNEDLSNVLIRLYNGTNQQGSSVFDIGHNESISLEFPYEGTVNSSFMVRIEENRSEFDNRFYFSLPDKRTVSVSLITDKPGRELKELFRNPLLFEFNEYSSSNIDYDFVKKSDLVIVDSFVVLPDWLNMNDILGDVLLIPGKNIDISSYQKLLPGTLVNYQDSSRYELNYQSLEGPFFKGMFEEVRDRITLPRVGAQFTVSGGFETILNSRMPYLVRYQGLNSNSQVYLFTDVIDPLLGHSIFLPIMYRIAEQTKGINNAIYYPLNEAPIVFMSEGPRNELYHLIGDEGSFIPEVYFNNTEMVLSLPPDLVTPGHYTLMAGKDTVKTLSLNLPKYASIVDYNSFQELEELYKGNSLVRIIDTSSLSELQAGISEGERGVPIWKYALLLALMFLVAETAIHRWLK